MKPADWITLALNGQVLCNTGQLDAVTRRALDREVHRGTLVKWRGHWWPVAGARHGVGPLKTCYGTPAAHAAVQPKLHPEETTP